MKIVVVGGTGLIGSKVVQQLKDRGQEVEAAAPNTGVDAVTGRGLAKVLTGAEVVVDVSNSPSGEDRAAMDFFKRSARNLSAAEQNAAVRHHVALSIVGTDRLQESGYFKAKLAQEKLIKASPVPYTLIHATQFFEFIRSLADNSTIEGMVHVPLARFQPMAADDVAAAIVECALHEPLNSAIEIAGPEKLRLDGAVRKILEHDHDQRRVIADPEALYYGAEIKDDTLLPGPHARLGDTTLEWWLSHVPAPRTLMPRMTLAH